MDPDHVEQMRLVYDPVLGDFRNLPGVVTRVPNFGSARGFSSKYPPHPEYCFGALRSALERFGYRDQETLFGAPYDFRYAPPLPGQTSRVYSRYFRRLMRLIEDARKKNQGRAAIVLGHSYGAMVAIEFVRNTPLSWRNKFIKHLFTVAPTWSGGYVRTIRSFASGPPGDLVYVPSASRLSVRSMWRTFEAAIVNLPCPEVFGRRPLVITKQNNYSAYDTADLLLVIGSADGVGPFKERELAKMGYFKAPMVPMTHMYGVGLRTEEQLMYWEGDFDMPPEVVYGDGDGTINTIAMLAFEDKVGKQPGQKERFKSFKVNKVPHSELVIDARALKKIMDEIVELNR
ncbi:Lecithin-cholesterol acyltransferase-like 1 [Dichanthelium oligosanthes]|uniref:Lecithin-cholesterol acyltransferase-like 1 n=1 Tax=Dichanthelium oligosanthes TaxID=888268 RepID=A0A1E5V456_9POAL|nr:Lecithin-cholesterol acyltransferase-like 1 [Dichanthelium oligosanthes]